MRKRNLKTKDDSKVKKGSRESVLAYAVKLLAARPRSVEEMRERLLYKTENNVEMVESIITKLEEYGYLDDERFALSYSSYRTRQKPLGRRRIKQELATKKISKEIADEALDKVFSETSEEEIIDRAIEKRIELRGVPKSRLEVKRFYDYLLRLGFSYELIAKKMRSFTSTHSWED
jgi:regulatory protein